MLANYVFALMTWDVNVFALGDKSYLITFDFARLRNYICTLR